MFHIGLDLGQRRDHTAIAVVERVERPRAFLAPEKEPLMLRHVERVPLGTPYPEVVARVREVAGSDELAGQCALVVDATGVGVPVVEMLRAGRLGCEITAVTITGGEQGSQRQGAGGFDWSVPKRDLIAGVQMLLEHDGLRFARGLREAAALVQELVDVRSTMRENGRVRLGADGCGEHDDLVIALALACWGAQRPKRLNGYGGGRILGI